MMRILIAGTKTKSISRILTFFDEITGMEIRTSQAESCKDVLSKTELEHFDLVIMDETLPDMSGLACIEKLVMSNPLINTAAVSSLPSEDFHEKSEGMGVLMNIPVTPEKKDMDSLIDHLKKITQLSSEAQQAEN